MSNLWEETCLFLHRNNLLWDDVLAIFTPAYRISKENFEKVARNTNYDSGYGMQEIDPDLMMLLPNNTYAIRDEYDGAEWWNILTIPKVPCCIKQISSFIFDEI